MEVSLTQIFDRPLRGREFSRRSFATIWIWAGPHRVQLVFDRVV
jgi:hypothetical protein